MVVKGRALETRSLQVTRRLGVMPRQLEAEYQMTGLSSGECEAKLNNIALSRWASLWGSYDFRAGSLAGWGVASGREP